MPKSDKDEPAEPTHSGVLPYRMKKGRPEILLVTARGSDRWVVPKGHIEDVGSRESARREAYEEAGVEGELADAPCGQYSHGGGDAIVELFLMEVTAEARTWPEEEVRQRRWVSLQSAARMVDDKKLREFLRAAAKTGVLSRRRWDVRNLAFRIAAGLGAVVFAAALGAALFSGG